MKVYSLILALKLLCLLCYIPKTESTARHTLRRIFRFRPKEPLEKLRVENNKAAIRRLLVNVATLNPKTFMASLKRIGIIDIFLSISCPLTDDGVINFKALRKAGGSSIHLHLGCRPPTLQNYELLPPVTKYQMRHKLKNHQLLVISDHYALLQTMINLFPLIWASENLHIKDFKEVYAYSGRKIPAGGIPALAAPLGDVPFTPLAPLSPPSLPSVSEAEAEEDSELKLLQSWSEV